MNLGELRELTAHLPGNIDIKIKGDVKTNEYDIGADSSIYIDESVYDLEEKSILKEIHLILA